ncbi:hypothetical protein [Loktanella sp. M215]|uniref:hypothetical protein n=1 Tax=Loktanella sp. M215 TaxID=2675431 RepID=UPI001F48E1E7|nr:hypothetical protein [Loktanella sp. M215]
MVHPGPVAGDRITAVPCVATHRRVRLRAGSTLLQAMTDVAGDMGAWFDLRDLPVATLTFVRPAPAPDDTHVAWYSDAMTLPNATIRRAGAHLGRRDGASFAHVHGLWSDTQGGHHAGHLLAEATVLSQDHVVDVWILTGALMDSLPDAETGFTLFCPVRTGCVARPNAVLAAIRPNMMIEDALAEITAAMDEPAVAVKGLGSIIGTRLERGTGLDDHATEVLLTDDTGRHVVSVGFAGPAVAGALAKGVNRVCVTFEVLMLASFG